MSRSGPTPRHVQRIPPPRAGGAVVEPQVIPIRGVTPEAPLDAVVPPAAAPRVTVRRQRQPVQHRPWQVLLVPPTPGSPTRSYVVARWQARLALGVFGTLLVFGLAAIAAVGSALWTPDLLASGDEVAALREQLAAATDSLSLARAALDETDVASVDATETTPAVAAPGTAASIATAPTPRADRPSPFSRTRPNGMPLLGAGVPASVLEGLPVVGRIASRFSLARRHPILRVMRPHLGVDVSAPRGTRISAPADGVVRSVERQFGFGLVVEVDHGGGVVTRYAHCRSVLVHEGERVQRGAAIATVGSSGLTTGPHLHYEVLVNSRPVDPLRYHFPRPAARVDSAGARMGVPASPPAPETGALTAGATTSP